MPPITTQQPAEFSLLERTKVPNGGTPTFEDMAAPLIEAGKSTSSPDHDVYYRRLEDSASIRALLVGIPVALPPVVTVDPDNAGAYLVRLPSSGGRATFVSGAFTKSQTGTLVTHLGGEHFRLKVDPSYAATVDQGTTGQASFEAEAVMDLATHRKISWTPVLINFNGTKIPAVVQGPVAVTQPAPRTFAEGVPTAFTEDLTVLFSGGAAPLAYQVLNSDGTALTNFVLSGITNGVASLTSQATGSGVKTGLYKVTDANGKTASVIPSWTVVANPLPVVLSGITPISIAIAETGNFPLAAASVFSDTESLTYALKNADGTAPDAGYSWDGVNIAYPVEGGAVTQSFILRATETGALARSVDTEAFTFDRPASPVVIIDPVQAVTWPENATTVRRVDVRTALGTDAAEDITIPAALTGKVTKNAVGSGVFDLTGTFANNEILSGVATYSGTLAGNPVQGSPTFKSIHNPPVDGLASTITATADKSITLDVVANSDDPAVNLIVALSANLDVGSAVISADRKQITLTPASGASATGSLTYTLEALAGGPQTLVTKVMDWRAVVAPQPAGSGVIATQSTKGIDFTPFNAVAFWTQGTYPLDPASVRFRDINGADLGTSLNVSGAGTFTIGSTGLVDFDQSAASFVGSASFRLSINDVSGNVGVIQDWTHTQLANPSDPPPPGTIIPNTLDGKPIMQRGIEADDPISVGFHVLLKNKTRVIGFEAVAAGSNKLWTTNLKGSIQKVLDGESDPTTGWFMLAPGESMPISPPRTTQRALSALANFQTGAWSLQIDVRTGDTADASQFIGSWAESGTVTDVAGGQSSLINGGAAFTFTRRRFARTLTSADTSQSPLTLTNSSGANIWVRRWWAGRAADEATWETEPFTSEGDGDLAQDKIIRIMDHCSPAGKAAYASNMVGKTDYLLTCNARSWVASGNPNVANSSLLRQGTNIYMWAKKCAQKGAALHFEVPITFGMGVTANDPNGFYTSAASANPFGQAAEVALYNAYAAVVSANFPSIVGSAKTEWRAWAQARVQDLIDAAYPDSTIVYIGFGNEIWGYNNFPLSNAFSKAVTDHLKARTGLPQYPANTPWGGAAYFANLAATEIARVVAEMKPNQQWKFLIGTQTNASAANTQQWADGWNVFGSEFPSASLPIGRLGIMTTSYLSEGFKWTNRSPGNGNPFGAQTSAEFYSAFNAAAAVSEDNLFQIIFNWYVNAASGASSVFGQLGAITRHKNACDAAGMEFLGCYEGSFHEDVSATDTTNIPGLIGYRNRFRDGSYGEAVVNRFIQEFTALYPTGIFSNYYKYVRDDNLATADAPWFELPVTAIGTVPTAGAAKAIYDNSRQGAGSITPPTNLNEDFEGETRVSLILAGMTLANGFTLVDDAGDRALYSADEFEIASTTLGSSLQANATRAVRLIAKPDGTRTAEYGRLIMTSNGDYVAMKPGASGALVLTYLGAGAPNAVTTTGLNLLDGSAHDLTITYYAATSGGVIEVKRTSDNFVYGTITGDTAQHITGGASPHIDAIELRGKVFWRHVENLTGVTPPVPSTEWETTATLAYAAGLEAGFMWDIDLTDLPAGAAHQFFQKAQADGGDIRAYLVDKTTRLPLHIMNFNKTAGTGRLRVRTPGAMSVGAVVKLKTGGDGTLTQPAASAQYGSQEVYQDFDLYTTDMTVNHKNGEIFQQFGTQLIAGGGPNGLSARGYDSQGVNAGDATDSILTTNNAALSCGIFLNRAAKGGGGVGVADTGFARFFHMRDGDDGMIQDNIGAIVIDREFSTTDGKWSVPYATLNTWAGFSYSHDGSTGAPTTVLNAVDTAPTVQTAPVGTFVAGTTPLSMGNHNGNPPSVPLHTRNFDGRLCEYWRASSVKTAAFQIAWQTMIGGLSTFATYNAGAAW